MSLKQNEVYQESLKETLDELSGHQYSNETLEEAIQRESFCNRHFGISRKEVGELLNQEGADKFVNNYFLDSESTKYE